MPRAARSVRARLALGLALVLAAGTALPTVGAAQPADAAQPAAARRAVVSGDARFEVLSPTLIRTEFADRARFVDAGTFNAIGRDAFPTTRFTSRTSGGWLTIDTGAVRLRYRVGSGAFTAANLEVSHRDGSRAVTASPWAGTEAARCAPGVRCEAEALDLDGPTVATDHTGYSGRGFLAEWSSAGQAVRFDVPVTSAGAYDLALRYANNRGGDGQLTDRTLSVSVDGAAAQRVVFAPTATWDDWQLQRLPLTLSAGTHRVEVVRGADDSGSVNVDNLAVLPSGAAYPGVPAATTTPCAFDAVCEADAGALTGGARLASDHNGASGEGFVGGLEKAGAGDAVTVTDVPKAGRYDLQLRYANFQAGAQAARSRDVTITTGPGGVRTAVLAPTSSWDSWRTVVVPVQLSAGTNTVALGCPTDDSCNVNVDTLAVTRTGGPLIDPHAALGGYRRGLDGVDGSARTNPGLLFQDGWSLLDDSASALYDAGSRTVTQRTTTGAQDGYVFAYGERYTTALADLARLTGPTKLLPRWTYGVWYSEYYDRTAADFRSIVARFRSKGVPLDALVIDTDYKSPNKWNGWEFDTTRIPNPKAFFAWAHAQGLRTALNLHPSILKADPRFAEAQRIAKGKLQPGACGGGGQECSVFDFGDPDQRRAYLALHDDLRDAGNDVWWLDWCCDATTSSLKGVTGDAWINQAYADYTATTQGRGFAFSRAYGSLEAGGYGDPVAVPTGPWADKRTTLHFSGDTTSDWATLAFEVGYTPGESASTGLAAVSHDIGGHTGGLQEPGSEPDSTKLPDDLYARWVQLGAFQPIDRLHSNHSDRLPWQYGSDADASASAFLNLRERLVPTTYSLAQRATATGTPIVRPLYLQYADQQEAYAWSGSEYLYGPDVLVAPVTTPGASATRQVWFPKGSTWTDWFTGRTYAGGTTARVTTGLDAMPVFVRSGGIVVTRTKDVATDAKAPLTDVTVRAAAGASGSTSLYEDDGTTTSTSTTAHSTTAIRAGRIAGVQGVVIGAAKGAWRGQPQTRAWTVELVHASKPSAVRVDGRRVAASTWTWDAGRHVLTVHVAKRSVHRATVVTAR